MSRIRPGARRRVIALLSSAAALAFLATGCGQADRAGGVDAPPDPSAGTPAVPGDAVAVPVETAQPTPRILRPEDLPPPFASPSANNGPQIVDRPPDAKLAVPAGFRVFEWADGLNNPRTLTVAPNGDVFVAESRPNRLRVLRDADKDGRPEVNEVFADDLRQPFGVAFYPPGPNPTHVYVANTDSVVRYPYTNGDVKASGGARTVVSDLPGGGYNQHWTRNVVFSPDGRKMYVSVGSQSNVGEEEEKRTAILEYNPDGTGYRVFASGLRNPVGLAFDPASGVLWTAVNERDGLGDDLVPDFATHVEEGKFYGWPYTYIGLNDEPRVPRDRPDLKDKTVVPDVLIGAHAAALGIEFYTGENFPAAYRNSAFVALHGSWNRAERYGYKIVRIPMDGGGRATGGYEDFVSGWKTRDGQVWGRPVDVAVASDGSLLVSDDGANKIYRVVYGEGGTGKIKQ